MEYFYQNAENRQQYWSKMTGSKMAHNQEKDCYIRQLVKKWPLSMRRELSEETYAKKLVESASEL